MVLTRRVRPVPLLTIAVVAFLAAWALLVVVIGSEDPAGADARTIAFGVVLGVASVGAAVSLLFASGSLRAISAISAGTATLTIGILGGSTVGLPLVPVGVSLMIVGLVAAEESARSGRVFLASAVAAMGVVAALATVALVGRGS
ncbi:MAG TPA: hypothetical protein VFK38_03410 [Candidatus Limnocylindrales bacterium]|nr:hypothetical protein [Candidatus Limnocylindrales bacterium]